MPDLNLDNPQVRKELTKIAKFYLDMGVAGFRLDAALHYFGTNSVKNISFLKWYRTMCQRINPNVYLVAEVWTGEDGVIPYYKSGLDSFFDFDLSDGDGQIVKAINKGNAEKLVDYLGKYEPEIHQLNPKALDAIYLSNHDQGRSAGYFPDLDKNKLAEAIYLWLPGRPYIYYGEEVRLKGSGKDENKRTYMPWGKDTKVKNPENTDYDPKKQVTATVKEAEADKGSLYNYILQLVAVRNGFPFLEHADFKPWKNNNRRSWHTRQPRAPAGNHEILKPTTVARIIPTRTFAKPSSTTTWARLLSQSPCLKGTSWLKRLTQETLLQTANCA